jgi:hypothetical protein
VVIDAADTMRRCAEELALFSELPAPWLVPGSQQGGRVPA